MTAVLNPFKAAAEPAGANGGGHPPAPQVRHEQVLVTPEMAKEWLARNDSNRPLRWPFAAQLARDIGAGRWDLNGETVKLAADGTLLDGQHRLTACVLAEVPFETFVVTGLPRQAQKTIDTGARRKMADVLALDGEKNAVVLAAVARWAVIWDRGGRMKALGKEGEPTHQEIAGYIRAHPELRHASTFAVQARGHIRSVRPAVFALAWLLFNRKDPAMAEEFLGRLLDGANIAKGHPAHTLRARIWSAVENGERLNEHEQLFLVVHAWNHYRAGNMACWLLKIPVNGLTPKNFPDPR